MGWFKDSCTPREKACIQAYLNTDTCDVAWDMIRAAYQSVSQAAIFLLQVCQLLKHIHFLVVSCNADAKAARHTCRLRAWQRHRWSLAALTCSMQAAIIWGAN